MIIQNSTINSSASRLYKSTHSSYHENSAWDNATGESVTETTSETTNVTTYSASSNGVETDEPIPAYDDSSDTFSFIEDNANKNNSSKNSAMTQEMQQLMERFQSFHAYRMPSVEERIKEIQEIQRESINYLMRILFGKDSLKSLRESSHTNRLNTMKEQSSSNPVTITTNTMGEILTTGGSRKDFYYHSEKETTCFDAEGIVKTADGREISFNISLEMSRSFTEMASTQIDFGQPRFCDPLVINLNSNIASVSDQKFLFDIDADGSTEEISMLNANSGYLALDKNEDGSINDGNELFGTQSGNGFADLAEYDSDKNGWIDEADAIFDKLKIWSMDENGNSTLINLKEASVGAIYLGYENTDFSLTNATNEVNAQIRKTGIFLYEEGYTGTIQQMDLAV